MAFVYTLPAGKSFQLHAPPDLAKFLQSHRRHYTAVFTDMVVLIMANKTILVGEIGGLPFPKNLHDTMNEKKCQEWSKEGRENQLNAVICTR